MAASAKGAAAQQEKLCSQTAGLIKASLLYLIIQAHWLIIKMLTLIVV